MSVVHAGHRSARGVFAAIVLVVAVALGGCSTYRPVTGSIGDTLTFSVSSDRQSQVQLTVLDLEPVAAAAADEWNVDRATDDVYFVHYTVTGATTRWSDWAIVTQTDSLVPGEVFVVQPVVGAFGRLPEEAQCDFSEDSDVLCLYFVVPHGETVTELRYYGVNNGYSRGSGIGNTEWAAWTVGIV